MENQLNVIVTFQHFSEKPELQVAATALNLFNKIGPFDILPGHANLISTIHSKVVIRTTDNQTREIEFAQGVLEVTGNVVKIFVEEDSAKLPPQDKTS